MGIAQRLTVVKQHDTEPAHHLRAGSRRTHGHPGYRTRRKRSGGAGFQQPSIPAKSPTMVLNPASLLLFVRMDKFFPRHGTPTARTAHACDFSRRAPLRISPPKKRGRAVPRHTYICMMPPPAISRPHYPKAPRTASSRLPAFPAHPKPSQVVEVTPKPELVAGRHHRFASPSRLTDASAPLPLPAAQHRASSRVRHPLGHFITTKLVDNRHFPAGAANKPHAQANTRPSARTPAVNALTSYE